MAPPRSRALATGQAQPAGRAAPPAPPHLARTGHEAVVTEFEQALICAGEAFVRFAGALLGP
ncbi:hypothetical protein ABTK13_20895, partial [Acinetobacter baumannii]